MSPQTIYAVCHLSIEAKYFLKLMWVISSRLDLRFVQPQQRKGINSQTNKICKSLVHRTKTLQHEYYYSLLRLDKLFSINCI